MNGLHTCGPKNWFTMGYCGVMIEEFANLQTLAVFPNKFLLSPIHTCCVYNCPYTYTSHVSAYMFTIRYTRYARYAIGLVLKLSVVSYLFLGSAKVCQ